MIDYSYLPSVCIQGLGFVGSAMSVAVAQAKDLNNNPLYNVIGVDLPTKSGMKIVSEINSGKFPFKCSDNKLLRSFQKCIEKGNLTATTDDSVYEMADIVIVDVHLDIELEKNKQDTNIYFEPFIEAIKTLGRRIQENCLVIIETTVPPGTCDNIVIPTLRESFKERGLNADKVMVAHSYERVMPGREYLDSIVNFWRVYSSNTDIAANECEKFFNSIINTKKFPLTRLAKPISTETAKVLENSYRAVNIAFIEEWGRFSERVNFDLYEVIDAIRMRPTHKNIRQPGFGVGGYCLTKDSLFARWSAKNFFDIQDINFDFCMESIALNRKMPLVSLNYTRGILGTLSGKKILVMGVSYREDVADTRFSPTETYVRKAISEGAIVECNDPLVSQWGEMPEVSMVKEIEDVSIYDLVIFSVPHEHYKSLDLSKWAGKTKIFDGNRVLTNKQRQSIIDNNGFIFSIGRGEVL